MVAPLPKHVHEDYHKLLKIALEKQGLNMPVGGVNGSTKAWMEFFRKNPGSQDRASDAVMETSRAIGLRHGTSVTQDVWANVQGGFFRCP